VPSPRTWLKGLLNIGAAVDARIRASTKRLASSPGSAAPCVPLSQGGFPGASGQGAAPVVPETWVESLQMVGAASPLSGALVLAGAGETSVTQSPAAPHFTVSSPSLGAADGVSRTDDVFSADATVVRTSGDQTIDGVKRFDDFPLTPATVPDTDNQVANKKYVDDQDTANQLWQRSDAVLSPAYSGDAMRLDQAVSIIKDSPAAEALVLRVAGENQPRFIIQLDGSMGWGTGSLQDTWLERQAAGVLAMGNGGALRAGRYCETEFCTSDPEVAGTDIARLFHRADTRAYSIGPGGAVHDLCVAHKQTFPAVGGAQGEQLLLLEAHAAYPAAAVLPQDYNAAGDTAFSWALGGGPATLGASYAKLDWTSSAQGGTVTTGAQVALGAVCQRYGGCADLRARLCVNNPQRFSELYLCLNDLEGHYALTSNLINLLTSDIWHEALLGHVNLTAWGESLRLTLTAQGTNEADHVGSTQLLVESLSLEQWAK
jgi:hypothetical protein